MALGGHHYWPIRHLYWPMVLGRILVWTVKEVSKETATYASSQDGPMTRRQLL